jgi:3-deoxy-D-manno-octulosonate 8-phosphate phosphatase KdsC-like HAD superfamily phosphatase
VTGPLTARRTVAALLAVAALAGCGAPPPQAPLPQAKKLDASTSDLATECGLTYQVTAFAGDHRKDLANLERQAIASARSLATVYARNPAWIYQGETVHDIVRDALSMLHTCGLTRAERTLHRATAH